MATRNRYANHRVQRDGGETGDQAGDSEPKRDDGQHNEIFNQTDTHAMLDASNVSIKEILPFTDDFLPSRKSDLRM